MSITDRATQGLATILYNPTAGRRRSLSVAEAIQSRLRGAGREVACLPTEGPGHAVELARERAAGDGRVIVVGGDGTLREAAEGLRRHWGLEEAVASEEDLCGIFYDFAKAFGQIPWSILFPLLRELGCSERLLGLRDRRVQIRYQGPDTDADPTRPP